MSVSSAGGRLVVLDRAGRSIKSFEVPSGLATLGRDTQCDVRVLLPHVSRHHATVIVHAVQTLIRNESEGETLVNGRSVSLAALQHGDVISIGGRHLRWEYADSEARRPHAAEQALHSTVRASVRGRKARGRQAARASAGDAVGAAMQLALHLQHRASMPGNTGGKQVAIVQPQRRDTSQQMGGASPRAVSSPRPAPSSRPRSAAGDTPDLTSGSVRRDTPRPRQSNMSPRSLALLNTTKATLWIESRKTSPRKSAKEQTPQQMVARRAVSAKKCTPQLRVAVLRKAQSAHKLKVTKIEAPVKIDQTKQAAIMLMTGHTPKLKSQIPKLASAKKTFVVKKPSPVRKTPRGRKSVRSPKVSTSNIGVTPKRASTYSDTSLRSSKRNTTGQSVSVLEITDSGTQNSTLRASSSKSRKTSTLGSPLPPSPKKSSLKDPKAKKSMRKTESIKFDLSNLENYSQNQSNDVFVITDNTGLGDSVSEDDATLHYDTSSTKSPSPRRSIHSRSSSRFEKLGTLSESRISQQSFMSAGSSRAKKSLRGSVVLPTNVDESQSGNNTTGYSRRSSRTVADQSKSTTAAFKTRTLSPRTSGQNIESYSIVDLVSNDSNDTARSGSVYDSAGSTRSSSIVFGTPHNSSGRKMRSTIEPNLLGSSTPYVGGARTSTRSHSSPNISDRTSSVNKSARSSNVSRRSKSLTTPENTQKHISVNSTRISRASRSRSRINDSDLQFISGLHDEADESPKSSRRGSKADKTQNISDISMSSPHQRSSSRKSLTPNKTFTKSPRNDRTRTPKHINSSGDEGSPVLSIRSLLDSSRSSVASRKSQKRLSANVKRKTIGVIRSERKGNSSLHSKSLNASKRKLSNSLRLNKDLVVSPSILNINTTSPQNERRSSRNNTSVADSPRSERRSSNKNLSLNITTDRPKNDRRSSRKNLTLNITAANSLNEGTVTPENVNSPEEVGTPVLCIQSLLDSNKSTLASHRSQKQRWTVDVIRPERKGRSSLQSKSLNISKRKSSRSLRLSKRPSIESDETDENAPQPDNEDTVTPKSAVKLVHEAVKNKHSTAKKPQSKRSLIDNLNDSDIIKQLFNSPVKRKLSQSMTEFTRKRLFDDDDEVPVKRPTRNTIALTGRTLDNSLLLDRTENITPDKFVSPLSTPSNSPNLTGIRRLYRKNTPENDLRNVKGVKGLLKTPRPRRSVRNDLTNVSGVKVIFGRSPKNRLSNVSGVKSLFKSPNVAKNDLSDVRGVKGLFKRKSAANDLSNVSGVKKTLQTRSPKNDLTDVRGVKRMFRQEKQRNVLDVSGIEELFNESNNSYKDSEELFDQLVGKPSIKAVYSKSFLTKRAQKQSKLSKRKSLQIPIDTIKYSPEEWVEQELKKRLHKDDDAKIEASTSKARKSLSTSSAFKPNVTRELQKLVTDTVEGDTPIVTSRIRNSTIRKSGAEITEMKKSASELYSARKLPLKKRSLVDRSRSLMEKSNNTTKSNFLPLKKRAVVAASTPVKERLYDMTMNVTELDRVSPIDANFENDITVGFTQTLVNNSPKAKGKAKPNPGENQGIEMEVQTETSRRPRGRRAANIKTIVENQELPPKQKGRRGTNAKNDEKQEIQIRTASPKTKSTRSKAKSSSKETSIETAPKTRTRNNDEKANASPQRRGARATKARNVVQNEKQQKIEAKPSPKRIRAAKAMAMSTLVEKSTRSRRKVDNTKVANTKKSRQSLVITKKAPVMSPKPELQAARKIQNSGSLSNIKVKSPKSRSKVAVVVINRLSPKFRTKAAKDKTTSPQVKSPAASRSTRAKAGGKTGKKTVSPKKSQGADNKRTRKTVKKPEVLEPQAKRSRGTRNNAKGMTYDKEVDSKDIAQSKPAGRSLRAKTVVPVVSEARGRRRKLPADQTVTSPKAIKSVVTKSTRGRPKDQTVTSPKATKSASMKTSRSKTNDEMIISPKATRTTRGRPRNQTFASPKATKSEVTKPTRGRPKNQTIVSPSATKVEVKKSTRGNKTVIKLIEEVESSKGRKKQTVKKVITEVRVQQGGDVDDMTKSKRVSPNTRKAQEEEAAPVTRRKVAAAAESAPRTGRKRNTSPAKAGPAKKARRGDPSPVKETVARGRSARGTTTDNTAARSTARTRRR